MGLHVCKLQFRQLTWVRCKIIFYLMLSCDVYNFFSISYKNHIYFYANLKRIMQLQTKNIILSYAVVKLWKKNVEIFY